MTLGLVFLTAILAARALLSWLPLSDQELWQSTQVLIFVLIPVLNFGLLGLYRLAFKASDGELPTPLDTSVLEDLWLSVWPGFVITLVVGSLGYWLALKPLDLVGILPWWWWPWG